MRAPKVFQSLYNVIGLNVEVPQGCSSGNEEDHHIIQEVRVEKVEENPQERNYVMN